MEHDRTYKGENPVAFLVDDVKISFIKNKNNFPSCPVSSHINLLLTPLEHKLVNFIFHDEIRMA